MTSNATATKLREVCDDIRRKPYPLSDLIPLLQKAADELDELQTAYDYYDPYE